jgi:hypothetical protein
LSRLRILREITKLFSFNKIIEFKMNDFSTKILTADEITNLPPLFEESFDALIRESKIFTNTLGKIESDEVIADTKITSHTYYIPFNKSKEPKIKEFIGDIVTGIIEYAIPRSKIKEAKDFDSKNGTSSEILKLFKEARSLFNDLDKSGEGGELILFLLAEKILKIPQIITKMSLKTDSQMHFHGSDGIHADLDPITGHLRLYWCESKIYNDFNSAIANCLSDVSKYLLDPQGENETRDDIRILSNYLDVDNSREELIKRYINTDDPYSNHLTQNAICLIGMTYDEYSKMSKKDFLQMNSEISEKVNCSLTAWKAKTKEKISKNKIEEFNIHVFFLPLPSADEFRTLLRKELKGEVT